MDSELVHRPIKVTVRSLVSLRKRTRKGKKGNETILGGCAHHHDPMCMQAGSDHWTDGKVEAPKLKANSVAAVEFNNYA